MADAKMVIWDLHTGAIVTNVKRVDKDGTRPKATMCACWGARKKDVKRRDTTQYQLATGGEGFLKYWTFDPATGSLSSEEVDTGVRRNITAVSFSHDREYLYAGSSSGDFLAARVKTLVMHSVTAACSNSVSLVVPLTPLPHGEDDWMDRVVVAGGDGSLAMWVGDGRRYRCSAALPSKLPGGVAAVALRDPNSPPEALLRFLVGTQTGFVFQVELDAGGYAGGGGGAAKLLQENHCGSVCAVSFAPDQSNAFVSASLDGTVRLWDASSYAVAAKGEVSASLSTPTSLTFTGEAFFSGWADGKVRAHDAEDGRLLWTMENVAVSGGAVTALAVSHNAKFFVSGGEHGEVRVWEIRTRTLIRNLKEHALPVSSLAIADGDDKVFSASRDRSILCWDLLNGARVGCLKQNMGGLNCIALHPDGMQLVSVGQEKKISFWDIREPNALQLLDLGAEQFAVALSADGTLFASGGADLKVRLWDMASATLLGEGVGHSAPIRCVSWAPDGKQLVSCGDDGAVLVWNIFYL